MRIKILGVIYLILLIFITLRLFYWQIIEYDNLTAKAEQQHIIHSALEAPRGTIYVSDNTPLALNKPAYLLYGLPKVIKNKEENVLNLAKILVNSKNKSDGLTQKEFLKEVNTLKEKLLSKLSQNLYWVILEEKIDFDVKEKIANLKIEGLGFENKVDRYYPEASLSAHVLGFTGSSDTGKQTGYFGIEGFYNDELRGKGGNLTEEKDAQGLPILTGKFFKTDPQNGHDLILHLDRSVQYIVEKKLKLGMEKFGAKSGSVVVMDPYTGAILAMVSLPSYDPNNFTNFPKDNFKNPIVADTYEPGSTFKPLIMAAAINENLVKPDTKCDICSGAVKASDYWIKTWNDKYHPNTTMTEVLINSDNTGMVFVSRKLGLDKIYQYITDFGFGEMTGIDLQDEISTALRPKKNWYEIDIATASFGQGIAITPIQMVKAMSAIANGGNLMEPHVVNKIKSNNEIMEIKPKVLKKIISEETAKTVTQMMVEAVDKGEAGKTAPKNYKIAGKTGTAQIPVAGHYDPTKTIGSFIGFAPADNPKFVMLVRYTEPSSSIFGTATAAPTFFEIAKELFIYFNISPDR